MAPSTSVFSRLRGKVTPANEATAKVQDYQEPQYTNLSPRLRNPQLPPPPRYPTNSTPAVERSILGEWVPPRLPTPPPRVPHPQLPFRGLSHENTYPSPASNPFKDLSYFGRPPLSPEGSASDAYYPPSNPSQASLQAPIPPPPLAEGWKPLWINHKNGWALQKDGTSITTWIDQSPIASHKGIYAFVGERANTIDLLKLYMAHQSPHTPKPLIDPGLFEKEGVEWGISDHNRTIYNAMFTDWAHGDMVLLESVDMFLVHCRIDLLESNRILNLIDPHQVRRGNLNMAEFAVAMHLVYRKLNEYPLPSVLPPQLVSALAFIASKPAAVVSQPEVGPVSVPAEPRLPEDGDWSGRGQHVEYSRGEEIPLSVSDHLGRGASADVHKVTTTGGVVLARKLIYCARAVKLEDVKRELEILRKVDHKHVIKLVGSYTQGRQLGILLYPAAVCDLGTFLDEVDEQQRSGETEVNEQLGAILEKLGLFKNRPKEYNSKSWDDVSTSTHRRLRSYYGCLVSGLEYLHQKEIRHKDIKTRNMLLDKDNGLFITDFGISRDNTDASTSVTNGIERGTYKYCAPEVATYEPRGRAADIYSLGCVFLEMETVYRGVSLLEFDKLRKENDVDSSFQANPERLIDWIAKLRSIPNKEDKDLGIFHIVDLIQRMLSVKPEERPKIDAVRKSLSALGDLNCKCVTGDLTDLEALTVKYRKVKGLYFDRVAERDQLKAILERLWDSSIIDDELKVLVPDSDKRTKQGYSTILDLPEATITAALSNRVKSTSEYLTASELKQENVALQARLKTIGMELSQTTAQMRDWAQSTSSAADRNSSRAYDVDILS